MTYSLLAANELVFRYTIGRCLVWDVLCRFQSCCTLHRQMDRHHCQIICPQHVGTSYGYASTGGTTVILNHSSLTPNQSKLLRNLLQCMLFWTGLMLWHELKLFRNTGYKFLFPWMASRIESNVCQQISTYVTHTPQLYSVHILVIVWQMFKDLASLCSAFCCACSRYCPDDSRTGRLY